MRKKLKEVLIIDDDATANYLNERIVKDLQITENIKVLQNGKEGLDYILSRCIHNEGGPCPELVILDHHMPLMSGMELMEVLHGNGYLEKMQVVFLLLAAHSDEKDLKRFDELGVQEFTTKPLSKKLLFDAYQKYWADDTARDNSVTSQE